MRPGYYVTVIKRQAKKHNYRHGSLMATPEPRDLLA